MADALPFVEYQYPASGGAMRPIALVGEAPGADEVRLQGGPSSDAAAKLLDKALANVAGIDRGRCLIANAFRVRPPNNKVAYFFASRRRALAEGRALAEQWGKLGAEYCLAEFAPELDALAAVLREQKPTVIIALGRVPLWALTGQNGITVLRGKPCEAG